MPCALPGPREPKSPGRGVPANHPRGGNRGRGSPIGVGEGAGGSPAGPPWPARPGLLLGWCGVAVGISLSDGRYSPLALTSVLLGSLAVAATLLRAPDAADARPRERRRTWRPFPPRRRTAGPFPPRRRTAGPFSWSRAACVAAALVVAGGPILRHPRYYAHGPLAGVADGLAIAGGVLAGAAFLGVAVAGRHPRAARPAGDPVTIAGHIVSTVGHLGSTAGRRAGRPPVAAGGAVFWTVLVLSLAAGAATVLAAPEPRIDVFHLLQVSTAGLADGENMYRQQWGADRATYTAGGLFDVYPYLPATSLLLAPLRWVFGDVRYGLLAALALAAVTVRALARRPPGHGRIGEHAGVGADTRSGTGTGAGPVVPVDAVAGALPLLVVVFPESMYALQQSWTEPLLVALLAGMVRMIAVGRPSLAVVAFALALASKQHVALLVPLAAAWPAFGPRRTLAAAALGMAVVAPWIVAAPRDFLDDAVRTNLDYEVLDHSLSVPGWAHHFGVTLGFGAAVLVLGAAYLLAWRARGGAAGFCAGSALVLLALDLMNKQTFFNHYTLPMALLVLALAAGPWPARRAAAPQPSVEKRSSAAPS